MPDAWHDMQLRGEVNPFAAEMPRPDGRASRDGGPVLRTQLSSRSPQPSALVSGERTCYNVPVIMSKSMH